METQDLRVKEILKAKKLTMNDLAHMLGINRVSLSNSLSKNPTLETLKRIAAALDIDLHSLFYSSCKDSLDLRGYLEYGNEIHRIECFKDLEFHYTKIKSKASSD